MKNTKGKQNITNYSKSNLIALNESKQVQTQTKNVNPPTKPKETKGANKGGK